MTRRVGLAISVAVVAWTLAFGVSAASAYIVEPYSAGSTDLVAGNPAEQYAGRAIEPSHRYDEEVPTRCAKAKKPGVARFVRWFKKRFPRAKRKVGRRYTCEKLSIGGYSMHSDGRAVDLLLDARKTGQYRIADKLIQLLVAPDSAGNVAALARRMGVFEIIYICGYWTDNYEVDGRAYFERYFMCNSDRGYKGETLATIQHLNHVHLSFTRDGGAARTSFWRPVDTIPFAQPAPEPTPDEPPPPSESQPPPS